ncbi:MAG: Rrf2 family transcriptional regulator [Deltaproteobacteria bacterium]|nr:Rrf2 family transcriptional regulator [Deltaproteobacteria bacterium]
MLSQTVGYAIRALAYLAQMKDKPVLVREISEATNTPHAFLAKIINTLGRKQFVVTQRGIRGGISLARKPESLSLYELCAALDDPLLKSRCILGMPECPNENGCPVHRFWAKHLEEEIKFLRETTLADIATTLDRQQRAQKRKQKAG